MVLEDYTDGNVLSGAELRANTNKALTENARTIINIHRADSTVVLEKSDNTIEIAYTDTGGVSGNHNHDTLYSGAYCWQSTGLGLIYNGDIYDTYSDASFDTTKWTSSGTQSVTNSEVANTYIKSYFTVAAASQNMTLIASGSGTRNNLNPVGTTSEIIVRVRISSDMNTGGTSSCNSYFQLTDGSNNVNIASASYSTGSGVGGTALIEKTYRIKLSGTTAYVTDSDSPLATPSEVDISSLVGTYIYPKAYGNTTANATTSVFDFRIYPIVSVNQTTVSTNKITTIANTITASTSNFLYDNGSSTVALREMSNNGGSNYTTATNKEVTEGLTSGTSSIVRYDLSGTALELLPVVTNTIVFTDDL